MELLEETSLVQFRVMLIAEYLGVMHEEVWQLEFVAEELQVLY